MAGNAIYHVNMRSERSRDSQFADSITFGAADDATAILIASMLGTVTGVESPATPEHAFPMSDAQVVSITKRTAAGDGNAGPYDEGTRMTANVLLKDENGAPYRERVRNADWVDTKDDDAWNALFMGIADEDAGIEALAGKVYLPSNHNEVKSTVVTGVLKS